MLAAIPFPDLSPEIFSVQIFGLHFALRWYAMAYIVGILLARWIILMLIRRPHLWPNGRAALSADQFESLLVWLIVGGVLGGRLGYVLFYHPAYYLQNPQEILILWRGGMAFHGGFLGVVLAVIAFCLRHRISMGPMADVLAAAVPLGLLLGRLANFINAELWGRPTDLPWAVIFPGAEAQTCINTAMGLCARHPSQLYEAALEGLLLGIIGLYLAFRTGALRRTGLLAGIFFAGYGLARFLVELVRQPDAQFQSPTNPIGHAIQFTGEIGLTMGQILSLPMIIVGIGCIWWSFRTSPQR